MPSLFQRYRNPALAHSSRKPAARNYQADVMHLAAFGIIRIRKHLPPGCGRIRGRRTPLPPGVVSTEIRGRSGNKIDNRCGTVGFCFQRCSAGGKARVSPVLCLASADTAMLVSLIPVRIALTDEMVSVARRKE